MKRSKPLRARSLKSLRRKPHKTRRARKRSKYRQRERATGYMLSVKTLPCAATIVPGHVCDGPIEADHAGPRGTRQKAHDSTVIPLCKLAHRQRADFSGPFRSWDQQRMRNFLIGRVLWTQRYLTARGVRPPPMTKAETIEIARWMDLRTADEVDIVNSRGRQVTVRMWSTEVPAEDLREDGNIDVRHPDAAPVARVVTEGMP